MGRAFVRIAGLVVLALAVPGAVALAAQDETDPKKQLEELKQQQELAEAKRKLADTQAQLLKAEQALAEAQRGPSAVAAALADKTAVANAGKAVAEADKATAEAKKAASEASVAAFKASIGEVPGASYTGGVEVKEKTGELEAALLALRAIEKTSGQVATKVCGALSSHSKSKTVAVMASGEVPTFQAITAFRVEAAVVQDVLDKALARSKGSKPATGVGHTELAPAAAVGLALEATNKLLSYFRTDYVVGGVTVTEDDSAFLNSLAGRLRQECKLTVSVPAVYNPTAIAQSKTGGPLLDTLTKLSEKRGEAGVRAATHSAEAARFKKEADSEKDETTKQALLAEWKRESQLADVLTSASTLFDTWFGKLSTANDKGVTPLVAMVKESVLADALSDGGYLLVIKVQKTGGGYLVKKNMWTMFGGMPLYHMGGGAVSYNLLDGKSGAVKAAGVELAYGGFVKAGKLAAELAK